MSSESFATQVLLRSEQSRDRVAVLESTVAAGFDGPLLHHHQFDEAFYVLEGELTFQLRDELTTAGPGELALAPGGVAHTLANLTGAPARHLLIRTPGGFERSSDRLVEPNGIELPPEAARPYPETVLVGPQISERLVSGS